MKVIVGIVAGIVLGAGGTAWFSDWCELARPGAPERESFTPAVHNARIVPVRETAIARVYQAPGQIVADRTLTLESRLTGRIERIMAGEGDIVEPGQVLVEIEATAVDSAIAQARAEISAAKAELADAQADVKRFERLARTQSLAEDELRNARVRVIRAQATLSSARATLTARQADLTYRRVSSPVRARLVERLKQPGDLAAPGAPLMRLEPLDPVVFETFLPGTLVHRVEVGATAGLRLDGVTDPLEAEVVAVVLSADPVTRRCKVKLRLPEGAHPTPGTFGQAQFLWKTEIAPTVPAGALIRRAGVDGVFVIEGENIARFRTVRVGDASDNRLQILAGLEPGAKVVENPPPGLADGDRIAGQ